MEQLEITAWLFLSGTIIQTMIFNIPKPMKSSLSNGWLGTLSIYMGFASALISLYLFFSIWGMLGLLYWFIGGLVISFIARFGMIYKADGQYTVAAIVQMATATFLWLSHSI